MVCLGVHIVLSNDYKYSADQIDQVVEEMQMEHTSKRVTLNSIDDTNKRYQVRDDRTGTFNDATIQKTNSKRHINGLVAAYKKGERVDIIKVVEEPLESGKYIIYDGFHRYAAMSKINKESKGSKFKQITVHIVSKEDADSNFLKLNSEHKGLQLSPSQRTEIDWQTFLSFDTQVPKPSKPTIHKETNIPTSTIGNWRREKGLFELAGYFKPNSPVEKNEITGFPILKSARDRLRKEEEHKASMDDFSGTEGLNEEDQKAFNEILTLVRKSNDSEKLFQYINHYWGQDPKYIDTSLELDIEDVEDDF